MWLLQTVGEVVWIKIVPLLIWFVNGTFTSLAGWGKLNQFVLIDVKIVNSVIVHGRNLNTVINYAVLSYRKLNDRRTTDNFSGNLQIGLFARSLSFATYSSISDDGQGFVLRGSASLC